MQVAIAKPVARARTAATAGGAERGFAVLAVGPSCVVEIFLSYAALEVAARHSLAHGGHARGVERQDIGPLMLGKVGIALGYDCISINISYIDRVWVVQDCWEI